MAADGHIIIDTKINEDGFEAGSKDIEAAARRMAASVGDIGKKAQISLEKQLNAFAKQNVAYSEQEKKVESLRAKVEELGNQKISYETFNQLNKKWEELDQKYQEMSTKQQELMSLGFSEDRAIGLKEDGKTVINYTDEMERLAAEMEKVEQKQQEMEDSGAAYIDPTVTEDYTNALNRLNTEEEKLRLSNDSLHISFSELEQKIAGLGVETENLSNEEPQLETETQNLSEEISELKTVTEPAPGKLAKFAKSLGVAWTVGKKCVSILGKLAGAIGKGVGKIASFAKQNNKSNSSMGMSLKKILKYALGIRSLFVLFNRLRSAAKEGFNNLVQYSSEANKSASMLKSSFTKLKNSFATAFAPLLSVVAPAITKVVNLMSAAMTKIGMFIAALTGNKTFVQAVDVQENYAASLDKTSSSAKKAAKSLKSYLSPLDEINRYDDGSDSDTDTGSGGYTGVDPKDMFKTVDITSPIKDIANKIRELIKAEDWAGLGNYIADGINIGVERIKQIVSWDNVGPGITKFCTAITETLNSLVDSIDWDNLGKTIGSGINTIINTIYLLITGINWKNIGKSIAKGINGILNSVDFSKLGATIGAKAMILPSLLYGAITTLDWSMVGLAIANTLNGILSSFDLTLIAGGLAAFINGISAAIISMVTNFDWEGLRAEIANGINTFLHSVDWENFASAISDLLTRLLSTMIGLIEAIDWTRLGMAIWDFISGIDWIGLVWNLFKLIIEAVGAGITAIGSVVYSMFSDLWSGVKSLFAPIGKWFKDLFSPATEWVKTTLGGILTFVNGVFSGNWKKAWEGIVNIFKGVWDGIVTVVKAPINLVFGLINGMLAAIAGGLNGIIRLINKLSFDVPDWVPVLGGKHFGFNISEITPPLIPYLAKGAVIPPNAPFTAVLGDQKRGTNIETPESLLRQIMREELGRNSGGTGGSYTFIGQINRRTLFEEVISEATIRQTVTGKNPFELA